ncbi:MAG: hypothetical protein ACQEQW_09000, partial [Bacteroidota bacterium]
SQDKLFKTIREKGILKNGIWYVLISYNFGNKSHVEKISGGDGVLISYNFANKSYAVKQCRGC